MSLIVNNRATAQQMSLLDELGYLGKMNLSVEEASKLIKELYEEERLEKKRLAEEFEEISNGIY